ncbi:MAG: cytochrome b N-terminal domain-containing protein, partial [Acidobacteriota bacterium]
SVGQEALLRFYVLHIAVLPLVMTLLISVHFWRIRKDGGLSRPEESEAFDDEKADWPKELDVAPAIEAAPAVASIIEKKRYGIQGLVRGPFTKVGNVPDKSVFSWPNLFMAELFVFVVTVAGVLVVSLLFDAPLEEPVNIAHPPNPAKAPWYFLGLQEMVSYSAFWGGVGIPTLEVLILLLVPYLDRNTKGVGRWFAKERLLANTLFMIFVIVNIALIIIGTFFRGPNWEFVSPW